MDSVLGLTILNCTSFIHFNEFLVSYFLLKESNIKDLLNNKRPVPYPYVYNIHKPCIRMNIFLKNF